VERTKVRDLISPHPLPLPNGERGREKGHKICERLNQPEAGKFPACKSFNLSAQEACQGFTCVRK